MEAATKRQRRCRLVAASGGDLEKSSNKLPIVAAFVASLLPLGIYAEAISNKPATEIHIPKIHPDLKHHLRGIEENLPGEREEATNRQQVAALLPLPCFYGLMSEKVVASESKTGDQQI